MTPGQGPHRSGSMTLAHPPGGGREILVLSNCQTGGMTACLDLFLPRDRVVGLAWSDSEEGCARAAAAAAAADLVVTSAPRGLHTKLVSQYGVDPSKCLMFPGIGFSGFHPDLTIAYGASELIDVFPGVPYQSAIGLWCWKAGLDAQETVDLFTAETMAALGLDRSWDAARQRLAARFEETGWSFADFFLPLQASGRIFMHTVNHPHLSALAQMARVVARRIGATKDDLAAPAEQLIPDALSQGAVWPVYPGVAESLGLQSSLLWKIGGGIYSLDQYLEAQFDALRSARTPITCEIADTPSFNAAMRLLVNR